LLGRACCCCAPTTKQERQLKKKEEFQFMGLFEGNFQLEHHFFLTNLERINGNSSIS
jgi:hypothetical protein